VPTVIDCVTAGGPGARLRTLTVFEPALATYAFVPATDTYAAVEPTVTLPVTTGGVCVRSTT
jgi:hypothetical protein